MPRKQIETYNIEFHSRDNLSVRKFKAPAEAFSLVIYQNDGGEETTLLRVVGNTRGNDEIVTHIKSDVLPISFEHITRKGGPPCIA